MMDGSTSLAHLGRALVAARRAPAPMKLGFALVGLGILLDLLEHAFATHAHDGVVTALTSSEHAAHLLVLVGMVTVLVAVVVDGTRTARHGRAEGSTRDAIR